MESQDYKQGGMGKDGTGRYGKHNNKKKTTLDETRGEDGGRKTDYRPTGYGLESGWEA